jgi:hypothetical protein
VDKYVIRKSVFMLARNAVQESKPHRRIAQDRGGALGSRLKGARRQRDPGGEVVAVALALVVGGESRKPHFSAQNTTLLVNDMSHLSWSYNAAVAPQTPPSPASLACLRSVSRSRRCAAWRATI